MDKTIKQDTLRVLLLTTARSYRNAAFLSAAERLGIEITQAVNMPKELSKTWANGISVDFGAIDESVDTSVAYHQSRPLRAIRPVDDSGSILAAAAAEALGLPHNSAIAAKTTRDKLAMRQLLSGSALNSPRFSEHVTGADLSMIISDIGFPCVVKPRNLNGSRGVIRANNLQQLQAAIERTARLVRSVQGMASDTAVSILIEAYIPGEEVALEGLLDKGHLTVLALFDKPDPLEGPFFEETIYVTPSRLSAETQRRIAACTSMAAAVLGLETGPVHAELRLNEEGPWIVEIAGRSIGGLCSQVLQFGTGGSLEEIILRQACNLEYNTLESAQEARGVMMIPIPGAGLLRGVDGVELAKKTRHIDGLDITTPLNNPITPLPEGDGYLGFIFASGPSPASVEEALRQAYGKLTVRIDPLLPLLQTTILPLEGR